MEQPDTIDIQEFRFNAAIKWQEHSRKTYMLIEALRDDPEFLIEAQECHAMEHERAMMHFDNYLLLKHR